MVISLCLSCAGNKPKPTAANPQDAKTYSIAVMKLKGVNISEIETETITEILYGDISLMVQNKKIHSLDNYILLERPQMDKVLDQFKMQDFLCSDDSCAVELGKILSVQRIIIGTAGLIGGTYFATCRIVDVGSSKVIRSANQKYRGKIDGFFDVIPLIGYEIIAGVKMPDEYKKTMGVPLMSEEDKQELLKELQDLKIEYRERYKQRTGDYYGDYKPPDPTKAWSDSLSVSRERMTQGNLSHADSVRLKISGDIK